MENQNTSNTPTAKALPSSSGSSTPVIDELRGHVDKLKALLDDPHPGLASWREQYSARMQSICDFWNVK